MPLLLIAGLFLEAPCSHWGPVLHPQTVTPPLLQPFPPCIPLFKQEVWSGTNSGLALDVSLF